MACLSGLKDAEWPAFLKSKLHKKTRADMAITIEYIDTGGFLSKSAKTQLKNASIEEKRAANLDAFKLQLALPINNATPKTRGSKSSEPQEIEPIGKGVTDLILDYKASAKFG